MSKQPTSEYDFPENIRRALYDTVIAQDASDLLLEWYQRWGDFHQATLIRMLVEGAEQERVFALFALKDSSLSYPEKVRLLRPFLEHRDRRARWASAICLGELQDGEALPYLQGLLLDGVKDKTDYPSEEQIKSIPIEAGDLLPFIWFNEKRYVLANTLGNWGEKETIPSLIHALRVSYAVEQELSGPSYDYQRVWYLFQDRLAYNIGRFGAFGTLSTLNVAQSRLRIAIVFAVLGFLEIKAIPALRIEYSHMLLNYLNKNEKTRISQVLFQQFGLTESEQKKLWEHYEKDVWEREKNISIFE